MSGNLDSQAQYFLEEIFGKNHKYEVVDGYYGDYMDVWVDEHKKDYEVKELHIEIGEWRNDRTTDSQEVVSFDVITAGSFFPSIEPKRDRNGFIAGFDGWDEWFSKQDYDCSAEVMFQELKTKTREWFEGGRSDWMEVEMEYEETFGDPGDCSFMLNIKPLLAEELEPHNVPKLDEINDFLKELKEIIDSHKK